MERLELILPLIMTVSMITTGLIACADAAYCKIRNIPSDPKGSPAFRPAFKFFGITSLVSLGAVLIVGLITEGCSGRSPHLY